MRSRSRNTNQVGLECPIVKMTAIVDDDLDASRYKKLRAGDTFRESTRSQRGSESQQYWIGKGANKLVVPACPSVVFAAA